MEDSPIDSKQMALECAQVAYDKKAIEIKVLDVGEHVPITDYFVLATAKSQRQIRAVADELRVRLKSQGVLPGREEGRRMGRWELIDFGSVVVHLFEPEAREYYDIDGLWADCEAVPFEPSPPPSSEPSSFPLSLP